MPIVDVSGVQIHYQVRGSGIPIVLIAGLAQDRHFWDYVSDYLMKDFKIITFDNRGIGDSVTNKMPFSVSMLANDVKVILDSLAIEKSYVLGHSFGAAIAFEFARKFSANVIKLIMLSGLYPGPWFVPSGFDGFKGIMCFYSMDSDSIKKALKLSTSSSFFKENPKLFNKIVDSSLLKNTFDRSWVYLSQINASMFYLQYDRIEKNFNIPLCLVYGSEDRIVNPDNAYRIRFKLSKASLHFIENCGHLIPFEKPREISSIIYDFCFYDNASIKKTFWKFWPF